MRRKPDRKALRAKPTIIHDDDDHYHHDDDHHHHDHDHHHHDHDHDHLHYSDDRRTDGASVRRTGTN